MRKQLYEMIDAGGDDKPSMIYDSFMICVVIASLIPLCFKTLTPFLEWLNIITVVIFIIDYILRWLTADFRLPKMKGRAFVCYPFTLWAIIDLLAILPVFLVAINPSFRLFKVLRLIRPLRVLKFLRYAKSAEIIYNVLKKEKSPLIAVCYLALGYIFITALFMFTVEPGTYDTIFDAIYWATTALTTVGYGDIYPVTTIGRIVSMVSSLVGIAVVALPAGIITAGYLDEVKERNKERQAKEEE